MSSIGAKQVKVAIYRLWDWQHGNDSFTCRLYGLMAKADQENFNRLSKAFPAEAIAFLAWKDCGQDTEKLYQVAAALTSKRGEDKENESA